MSNYVTNYETNERLIDDSKRRAPTGRYHSLITYLPKDEIERVLNHWCQYIDSALYICHDRDKKHCENDMGVLLKDIKKLENDLEQNRRKFDNLGTSESDKESAKKLDASYRRIVKELDKLNKEKEQLESERDDLKPAHWHVLIKLFGNSTESAVRKYFYRFRVTETKIIDGVEQTVLITTTNELVDSVGAARDYLTHENDPDKYHYSKSDVYTFGRGWEAFQGAYRHVDSSMEIVDRLMHNTSLRRLVKEYGKDFVYHYKAYAEIARAIHQQEMGAQNYVDLAEIAFKRSSDVIIDGDDDHQTIKLDPRKFNKAVEIVTEFEHDFQLFYQGE